LSIQDHSACVLYGASVLVISTILKLTPAHLVEKLPVVVDENKPVDPNDKILAAYNKQNKKPAEKKDAVKDE